MKSLYFIPIFCLSLTFELFAQKPDIQTINKTKGTVGQVVTISGSGFASTTSQNIVYFGAARGNVISATNSTLEVMVPPGATFNQISVTNTVSGLMGHSSEKFLLSFSGQDNIIGERLSEKIEITEESGLFDFCVCDFNNDRLNDIITTNNNDQNFPITAYLNTTSENESTIKFARYDDSNFLLGEQVRNVACGDLDGDGKPDFIAGKGGNIADRLYLFRNITSNNVVDFDQVYTLSINIASTQASTRRIKIHDLDNDGKPEIIMTDQRNSYVHVFKNNSSVGQFNFSRDNRLLIPSDRITLGLDIADINRDGKPDIVYGSNLASDVYVAVNKSNNGSLSFEDPVRINVQGQLINLVTGDFDLDGDQDIAVVNFVNNIYILLNQSTTSTVSFSNPQLYETGILPYGIDVGDLNGDGKIDIVVTTNEATEPITILENNSTTGYLSFRKSEIGQNEYQRNVRIADFSGDAKPDIGYTIDGVNKVAFLRNQHCVTATLGPEKPKPICADNPSTLHATKALKVEYAWANQSTGDISLNTDFDFDVLLPGTYSVTVQSEVDGCESTSNQVEVVVGGSTLPPTPTITGPEAVCEGGNLTLQSNLIDNVSYFWTTPDGNTYQGPSLQVNNVSGEDAGRYSLVLEGDGCQTDPVSKNVDISIVPDLEITASQDQYFCEGTQNILSVADLENGSYTWYKNGQAITGSNLNQLATSDAGDYYVTFSNQYDCNSTSNTFTIYKVAAPIASFNANESACLNETVTFENTSQIADGIEARYIWNLGNDVISEEFEPTRVFSSPGTYYVSLTVSYGNQYCQDKAEKTIVVSEAEGITIMVDDEPRNSSEIELCGGDSVKLSVDGSLSQIEWSTGSTENEIFVSQSGSYSVVVVQGDNACNSSDQIYVSVIEGVNVEITTTSTRVEKGGSIQLEAIGAEQYEWTPAETLDNPFTHNPVATPEISTIYTVTGYNSLNCSGTDEIEIVVGNDRTLEVLTQPVFTPNGDGINDLWIIDNSDIFDGCTIVIMNRNGQVVYEADTYHNDWDATANGNELPEETYYYVIQCNSNEVHTGSITVMR